MGGFIHNIAEGSKASGTSNKMELKLAGALLCRQLEALVRAFEREGGFTERLYRVRAGKRRMD